MDPTYLIVPGLGDSGPLHWQTHWERRFPDRFIRIQQTEWGKPVCDDWIANIDQEVRKHGAENVVLLAHSLGCAAVAHWAGRFEAVCKGAFLVAPSDCEAATYTFESSGFDPIPLLKLPFPTLVIASTNDYYVSLDRAAQFAEAWGSEFIDIGDADHINGDAGFGEWPEGLELLKKLN